MNNLLKFIATLAGIGRLKPAPGTLGSAAVALALWVFAPSAQTTAVLALLVTIIGCAACFAIDARGLYGANADPSEIVIDEAAGMLLAAVACGGPAGLAVSFLMFRLFDIKKPFGITWLESAPRGQGIMLDDLAAGAFANVVTAIFLGAWQ